MDQAITTLIGVAFGGIIGFFSALYVDTRERKYDLKRQVYFEFIDITTTGIREIQDYIEKAKAAFKKHDSSTDNSYILNRI